MDHLPALVGGKGGVGEVDVDPLLVPPGPVGKALRAGGNHALVRARRSLGPGQRAGHGLAALEALDQGGGHGGGVVHGAPRQGRTGQLEDVTVRVHVVDAVDGRPVHLGDDRVHPLAHLGGRDGGHHRAPAERELDPGSLLGGRRRVGPFTHAHGQVGGQHGGGGLGRLLGLCRGHLGLALDRLQGAAGVSQDVGGVLDGGLQVAAPDGAAGRPGCHHERAAGLVPGDGGVLGRAGQGGVEPVEQVGDALGVCVGHHAGLPLADQGADEAPGGGVAVNRGAGGGRRIDLGQVPQGHRQRRALHADRHGRRRGAPGDQLLDLGTVHSGDVLPGHRGPGQSLP